MYKLSRIIILNLLFSAFLNLNSKVIVIYANNPIEYLNSSSAKKNNKIEKNIDERILKLSNFLKGYPLEESAVDFINIADKYNLGNHVYLVAAISGVESTFGKFIPYNSFNAWGFGIPTGEKNGLTFSSWEEGIERVTKTLATENIYVQNKNISQMSIEDFVFQIGPVYAQSPVWAEKVLYFLKKIDDMPATPSSVNHLDINL